MGILDFIARHSNLYKFAIANNLVLTEALIHMGRKAGMQDSEILEFIKSYSYNATGSN